MFAERAAARGERKSEGGTALKHPRTPLLPPPHGTARFLAGLCNPWPLWELRLTLAGGTREFLGQVAPLPCANSLATAACSCVAIKFGAVCRQWCLCPVPTASQRQPAHVLLLLLGTVCRQLLIHCASLGVRAVHQRPISMLCQPTHTQGPLATQGPSPCCASQLTRSDTVPISMLCKPTHMQGPLATQP